MSLAIPESPAISKTLGSFCSHSRFTIHSPLTLLGAWRVLGHSMTAVLCPIPRNSPLFSPQAPGDYHAHALLAPRHQDRFCLDWSIRKLGNCGVDCQNIAAVEMKKDGVEEYQGVFCRRHRKDKGKDGSRPHPMDSWVSGVPFVRPQTMKEFPC